MGEPEGNLDRELAAEVWKGACALCFHLDDGLVQQRDDAGAYMVLANRVSYLFIELNSALPHFNQIIKDPSDFTGAPDSRSSSVAKDLWEHDDIWLESRGQPLRWQYPIGVLYDLYHRQYEETDGSIWNITVRVGAFPGNQVLRYETPRTVEGMFFNTFKQGLYVKFGTTSSIMGLPKKEQDELWTSLQSGNSKLFLERQQQMLESSKTNGLRAIPIRLVRLSPEGTMEIDQRSVVDGETCFSEIVSRFSKGQIYVAGIEVPSDVPLRELYNALAYPDQFLYIVEVRLA